MQTLFGWLLDEFRDPQQRSAWQRSVWHTNPFLRSRSGYPQKQSGMARRRLIRRSNRRRQLRKRLTINLRPGSKH